MAQINRVSGVCYCKIDGDMLALEGSVTITPYDSTREAVATSIGVIGFSETPRSPTVEVTAYLTLAQLKSLRNSTSMTITAELANGIVYTLSEAFVTGDPSIDAQAGTTSITFSGVRGEFQ